MRRAKKAAFVVLIVLFIQACVGYVTATAARSAVERETRAYVVAKGIKGIEMGGREVPPEEIPITSHVKWPFVVVATYEAPFDLHASYHRTTYFVLPWARYVLSKENIYPV